MTPLAFDATKCVRSVSKFSTCTHCEQSCPTKVITLKADGIAIDLEGCIGCGACCGACPTQALTLPAYDLYNIFETMNEPHLSCGSEIPCVALLGVDDFLAFALKHQSDVRLDLFACQQCEASQALHPLIIQRSQEANLLLESLGYEWRITLAQTSTQHTQRQDDTSPSRRDFFEALTLKNALKAQQTFEEQINEPLSIGHDRQELIDQNLLKNKIIPPRRAYFYTYLKACPPSPHMTLLPVETTSTFSYKSIDATQCTNCGICHRLCPTGALSTGKWGAEIFFNPLACVKCSLCHDACETQCLHLAPLDPGFLGAPHHHLLVRHTVRRCTECGVIFKFTGGDPLCPRCTSLDDEARELTGF